MKVAVTGVGRWTPSPGADEPPCAIADGRAKRGTSRITRMLGEVVEQAVREAGADVASVATVYASAWGEIDIMVGLLAQIHDGDVGLSPLRFKHSVHNAASGLVSIAASNRAFSTAIAAGERTVEQGVVEAWALLAAGTPEVVLAAGDDRLPAPLDRFGAYEGFAGAVCLTRDPGTRRVRAWLERPRPLDSSASTDLPEPFATNPSAWLAPLLDAIAAGQAREVVLSAAARPLAVSVTPGPLR
jgi:3-oxoacyl-(acyl-carrier-protein) synthase